MTLSWEFFYQFTIKYNIAPQDTYLHSAIGFCNIASTEYFHLAYVHVSVTELTKVLEMKEAVFNPWPHMPINVFYYILEYICT